MVVIAFLFPCLSSDGREKQKATGLGTFNISRCDIDECSKWLSYSMALLFSSLPTHGSMSDIGQLAEAPSPLPQTR